MQQEKDHGDWEDGRHIGTIIVVVTLVFCLIAVALSWRECAPPPSGPPPVPTASADAAP